MIGLRKIRIKKGRPRLWYVAVLVLIICGIVSYQSITLHATYDKKQESLSVYENKVKELEKEKEELEKDTTITRKDIEKIARERLNLVYEDEVILKPEK